MNPIFSNFTPDKLWYYFGEICKVPRPSKKETLITNYITSIAQKLRMEYQVDECGNILIRKPATKGFEDAPVVILQSHIDMVCEKNSDTIHNFETDPIIPRIEGQWVKATGTTLGADDGIGIAAQLAILDSDTIEHGPLEMLFTIDEETGLSGAKGLKSDFLKGRILLNLDSEDEGELFIGCAGGRDTKAVFNYSKVTVNSDFIGFKVQVSGLKGGHSGDDINKGHGNAIKILTRLLWLANQKYEIRISTFKGGNLRNAIPREAFAEIVIPTRFNEEFQDFISSYSHIIQNELINTEPDLSISCESTQNPSFLIDLSTQERLLNSLYACPHGVITMSPLIPNFVDTSTNLASVKMTEKSIEIGTSQRSSSEPAKEDIVNMVESVFLLAGCKVSHDDGYPGWAPNANSPILEITKSAYIKLFNTPPKVLAIHAGLECGLIGEKFPGIDMISYGPTIKGAHSPDERLEIASVNKFWDLTLEVLKNIR